VISKNVGAATEAVEYALPIAKRQNAHFGDRDRPFRLIVTG